MQSRTFPTSTLLPPRPPQPSKQSCIRRMPSRSLIRTPCPAKSNGAMLSRDVAAASRQAVAQWRNSSLAPGLQPGQPGSASFSSSDSEQEEAGRQRDRQRRHFSSTALEQAIGREAGGCELPMP